jgi:hypothetical protein
MPTPDGPNSSDADSTTPLVDQSRPRDQVDPVHVRRVLERLATEPLRLRSDNLVQRPWGGRRLITFKSLEGAARAGSFGESFEVSAFPRDPESARYPSMVEFDDGSAMWLTELLARAGEAVLGPAFFAAYGPRYPLLPKFLDVEALLSVQSHPRGNPEVYVVIDCEPGASLRIGFARDVDANATVAALEAGRADQEELLRLLWVSEDRLAQVSADLFGTPDAVKRLCERFTPLLRDAETVPQLCELLTRLDTCYRETLGLLNRIEIAPGMVLFNAHPPGSPTRKPPSAEVHCLGNPERKWMLLLEIRRPGVTYRAWDHVRFPLRELAIGQALEVMNCAASRPEDFIIEPRPIADRPGVVRSVECPAFVVDHLRPRPGVAVVAATDGLPSTLHGIRGTVRLYGAGNRDWGILRAGQSLVLPYRLTSLRIEALTPDAELVQVTVPLPPMAIESVERVNDGEARRCNVARMRQIVAESAGPREVLAIVNPGDCPSIAAQLSERATAIFRADGGTAVHCYEERSRRGQLLGMLDTLRAHQAEHGELDPEHTAVGIMLPGKGTRLSPLTQRLRGIKPLFPVPIRADQHGTPVWLDAATASLWSWTLVAWTLERQGFRGIAWKWGDEPQIAARDLANFDHDLSDVDAVRFGAAAKISEDLARNKEWLLVDTETGDLVMQLRRRDRKQLLERMGLLDEPGAAAHVHIGSPAFSHLFLRHAEDVFGDCEGWLDVDGYLFEALTQDLEFWAEEVERDRDLQALLARCPDFYERARELRRRIEDERGHAMRIVVIDFGIDPYWADVGQLDKARAVWSELAGADDDAAFARLLAGIEGLEPDRYDNYLIGNARIPTDGTVRNCVIIDSEIAHGRAVGAVVMRSSLGVAGLEPGAVVIDCKVNALRMGHDTLAFGSVGDYLRLPDHHVHTSIVADPDAAQPVFESWFADARQNPGAPENYEHPRHGNPTSFAAKLEQMRRR